MIFLVVYDRRRQSARVEAFSDDERSEARRRRLEVQLEVPSEEGRYEVVLLESRSMEDLKVTHARYFSSEADLIESSKAELLATQGRISDRTRHRSE